MGVVGSITRITEFFDSENHLKLHLSLGGASAFTFSLIGIDFNLAFDSSTKIVLTILFVGVGIWAASLSIIPAVIGDIALAYFFGPHLLTLYDANEITFAWPMFSYIIVGVITFLLKREPVSDEEAERMKREFEESRRKRER